MCMYYAREPFPHFVFYKAVICRGGGEYLAVGLYSERHCEGR